MTAARTVYVVISCDVDPDRERFLDGIPPGSLEWRGVNEGIPALKASLRGLHDAQGREPVCTWFLRADHQIREVFGSYTWFVRERAALLGELEDSGDELGWHPHFWRRASPGAPWFQETEDVPWQLAMLEAAHAELAPLLPRGLRSVRMGWSYHTNVTLAALGRLGIAVDLSALPGYRTFSGAPRRRSENQFDWYEAPRTPYHPSRADYRRPARNGADALGVLEVPSFMSRSLAWSVVGGAQLTRKTGDLRRLGDALRRPTYCINVTARPRYFAPLVAELRRALRRPGGSGGPLVFETHFHADELVQNRSALYDLPSVRANLEAVRRACTEAGVPLAFVRAGDLPALVAA